ncbi:hypothetical protein HK405_010506 [Cladochytrium tenue]|nr:hypothetical protein HK405_010506 [Cladochytrium tenue]
MDAYASGQSLHAHQDERGRTGLVMLRNKNKGSFWAFRKDKEAIDPTSRQLEHAEPRSMWGASPHQTPDPAGPASSSSSRRDDQYAGSIRSWQINDPEPQPSPASSSASSWRWIQFGGRQKSVPRAQSPNQEPLRDNYLAVYGSPQGADAVAVVHSGAPRDAPPGHDPYSDKKPPSTHSNSGAVPGVSSSYLTLWENDSHQFQSSHSASAAAAAGGFNIPSAAAAPPQPAPVADPLPIGLRRKRTTADRRKSFIRMLGNFISDEGRDDRGGLPKTSAPSADPASRGGDGVVPNAPLAIPAAGWRPSRIMKTPGGVDNNVQKTPRTPFQLFRPTARTPAAPTTAAPSAYPYLDPLGLPSANIPEMPTALSFLHDQLPFAAAATVAAVAVAAPGGPDPAAAAAAASANVSSGGEPFRGIPLPQQQQQQQQQQEQQKQLQQLPPVPALPASGFTGNASLDWTQAPPPQFPHHMQSPPLPLWGHPTPAAAGPPASAHPSTRSTGPSPPPLLPLPPAPLPPSQPLPPPPSLPPHSGFAQPQPQLQLQPPPPPPMLYPPYNHHYDAATAAPSTPISGLAFQQQQQQQQWRQQQQPAYQQPLSPPSSAAHGLSTAALLPLPLSSSAAAAAGAAHARLPQQPYDHHHNQHQFLQPSPAGAQLPPPPSLLPALPSLPAAAAAAAQSAPVGMYYGAPPPPGVTSAQQPPQQHQQHQQQQQQHAFIAALPPSAVRQRRTVAAPPQSAAASAPYAALHTHGP